MADSGPADCRRGRPSTRRRRSVGASFVGEMGAYTVVPMVVFLILLVAFDVLALRFGVDSRDSIREFDGRSRPIA